MIDKKGNIMILITLYFINSCRTIVFKLINTNYLRMRRELMS